MIKEFPEKDWKLITLNYLPKKLRDSGSMGRKPGSGRQQTIIDDVIDGWHARLRACVPAKGGQFEHLMYSNVLQLLIHVFFILVFHLHVKN